MSKDKMGINTPLGKLTAVIGSDPSYPEICIYIERKDGIKIGLVDCEVNLEKNIAKGYLYGDTECEDYTQTHVWTADEINV